jgi:hypothetical protein
MTITTYDRPRLSRLLRSKRLDEIVAAAREASISTHGGLLAITAASSPRAQPRRLPDPPVDYRAAGVGPGNCV